MATVTETYVGQKNDTTATTHVFSGVNISAGKLAIIRLIVSDGVTVNNPTDSAGNTWGVAIPQHDAGGNQQVVICYSVLTNALVSGTVTINLSATSTCGAELSWFDSDTGWLAQASVLDQTKGAIGSVAAWSTGAASTTTQADELLVGACGKINFNGSSSTPDAPWIEETDQVSYTNVGGSGLTTVWQKVTTTGAYAASGVWGAAEFWQAALATFKTAAGVTIPATAHHPLVSNAPKGFMFNGLSREDFSDVARDSSLFNGAITPRKRFIAAQAGGFYFASVPPPVTTTPVSDADTGTGVDAAAITAIGSVDVNGATTESATLVALISTTDVNGTTTEATAIQQWYTSADTGTGAESQLVTVPISGSDVNGTTTEAVTLTAAIPVSDTGVGVNNTGTVLYAIPASDVNGTTTEATTLVATGISSADVNGATTETQLITVPVAVSDTGVGVDAISAFKLVTPETATDAEATTLVATGISSADVNGVTTESTTLVAVYSSADTGSGVEGISDRKIVLTETATGVENQSVITPGAATDNEFGTGVDVANVALALIPAAETSAGADTATLVALISTSDVNGATTESTRTFLASADTGAGSESANITTPVSSADTGVGVDAISTFQTSATDTGSGVDAVSALRTTADEIGSGIDAQTEVAKFTVADTGSGVEAQAVTVPISGADTGAGVNAQSLSVALSAPETASGLESASLGRIFLTTAESASGIELQILQARLSSFDISFGVDFGKVETGYVMTGGEPQWMIDARIDGTLVDVVIANRIKVSVAQLHTPILTNAKVE